MHNNGNKHEPKKNFVTTVIDLMYPVIYLLDKFIVLH